MKLSALMDSVSQPMQNITAALLEGEILQVLPSSYSYCIFDLTTSIVLSALQMFQLKSPSYKTNKGVFCSISVWNND